jgi:hypothetical protein
MSRYIKPETQEMVFVEHTIYHSADANQPHRTHWLTNKGNFWESAKKAAQMCFQWGLGDLWYQEALLGFPADVGACYLQGDV